MTNTTITFDDHSITELKTLQADLTSYLKEKRAEIKSTIKADRAKDQETRDANGRSIVTKGKEITVNYKGTTLTGTVTKIAEKTFTIETEINGEAKKIWRYFHQVI